MEHHFFELAVAVAIALFGMNYPAALATTVGVLTRVPLMLFLVYIANKTSHWFPKPALSFESSQISKSKLHAQTSTVSKIRKITNRI